MRNIIKALAVGVLALVTFGPSELNAATAITSATSRLAKVALNPQPLPPKVLHFKRKPDPPPLKNNSLAARGIIIVGGKNKLSTRGIIVVGGKSKLNALPPKDGGLKQRGIIVVGGKSKADTVALNPQPLPPKALSAFRAR